MQESSLVLADIKEKFGVQIKGNIGNKYSISFPSIVCITNNQFSQPILEMKYACKFQHTIDTVPVKQHNI